MEFSIDLHPGRAPDILEKTLSFFESLRVNQKLWQELTCQLGHDPNIVSAVAETIIEESGGGATAHLLPNGVEFTTPEEATIKLEYSGNLISLGINLSGNKQDTEYIALVTTSRLFEATGSDEARSLVAKALWQILR